MPGMEAGCTDLRALLDDESRLFSYKPIVALNRTVMIERLRRCNECTAFGSHGDRYIHRYVELRMHWPRLAPRFSCQVAEQPMSHVYHMAGLMP